MKKNIQKLFRNIAVIFLILINIFANSLMAKAISIPSVSSVASQLESRYHLNLGSMQNAGETFNVGGNKKLFPQALFTFSPTDPKVGEQLTVQASAMYFSGTPETLYYTWYLKHDASGGDDNKGNIDWDGKNGVDEEDYKIAAMRILAQGGWEPNYKDKGVDEDDNDKNDKYYTKVSDSDDDGYKAAWGGDANDVGRLDTGTFNAVDNNEAYCYLFDVKTGKTYEIRDGAGSGGSPSISGACFVGNDLVCLEDNRQAICTETVVSNPGPPPIYSTSMKTYNVCMESDTPTCENDEVRCNSGTAYCVPTGTTFTDDCNVLSSNRTCAGFYGATIANPRCDNSASSGIPPNFCKHLFPNAGSGINRTGEGNFEKAEEKFWLTNPEDPDTSDNGNMDEANLVGLGQKEFTWSYQEGDQVGVFIEGMSVDPTKHDDSSYKLMWGTPVKPCELTPARKKDSGYTEKIKGYDVKIPYYDIGGDSGWKDFWKKCMKDNFVDPRQGGQSTKLNVALSKTPENPINDPNGKRGDIVTVQSNIDNLLSEGTSTVEYNWKIQKSNLPNSDRWLAADADFNDDISNLKGNDLSSLSFRLNLKKPDDLILNKPIFYLKVKLEARENFSAGVTRLGRGEIIIKVTLPIKMEFKVKEAPPAVRGDTSKGGIKVIILENGATLNAPMFIKEGDIIRVNTETGEYVERV